MRYSLLAPLLISLFSSPAVAQSSVVSEPRPSRIATLVGAGNSFSGTGVLADIRPFAQGPFSLMLSIGATKWFFDVQENTGGFVEQSTASVAAAVGVRATLGRGRHRAFLEAALLPVDDDVVALSETDWRLELLYGLGLQLGYRFRITPAITLNALGGAGYALNEGVVASRWKPLFGFGVGYEWR